MLGKDVILHCPRCQEVMIREPGFWRCPRCGGEFWDDESRLREMESQEMERQMQEALRLQARWCLGQKYTEVLPAGPTDPRKRGSHSSSRRKKKKPVPKFLMIERYLLN